MIIPTVTILEGARTKFYPFTYYVVSFGTHYVYNPSHIGFFETNLPGHKKCLGRSLKKKIILKTLFQRAWPYESVTSSRKLLHTSDNFLWLNWIIMVLDLHLTHPLNSILFLIWVSNIFPSHVSEIKSDINPSVYLVRNVLPKCFSIPENRNADSLQVKSKKN